VVSAFPRCRLGRLGSSRRGCLFAVLLCAVVLYYGVNVVGVYLRYWQLRDEMHSAATLAPSLDDETIQRRLVTAVDDLRLPAEARRFVIRRRERPREISISTSYSETIDLPFTRYTFHFHPEARAPL
jgi:hypothetical protein